MKIYKVIVTPDAEADLLEIGDYIAFKLLQPETALEYVYDLRDGISDLSYMGASIAPVPVEPWHSRGLRKILVKKFYIYYLPDDESDTISVMNVIYCERDQIKALREKLNMK